MQDDGVSAQWLAELRLRSDVALAGLGKGVDPPFGLHNHSVPPVLLKSVGEQLALARAEVDNVARHHSSSRSRDEFQGAIDNMFEVSNRFRTVVAWSADHLIQHDNGLAAPALVGEMLADLRDYGGRVASQIIVPLATRERLPLENVIAARRTEGRMHEIWDVLNKDRGLFDNPALARGRDEIHRRFFGVGLGLVDGLIREGQQQQRYSLTSAELTERFVPTMQPIEVYRKAFLDATVDHYSKVRDTALRMLLAVTMFATCVLVILGGLMHSIRRNVFRPLMLVHDEVLRLADDRPAEPQAATVKTGEIHGLFKAIEVLQGKLKDRANLTSQLRVQANTDCLTALLNRRALDLYAQSSPRRETDTQAICLVILDIDHFKMINDTYGHPTGDRVLIQVAALLSSNLRAGDVVARFGGEEFAILVPGDSLSGAISIARKLRLALQRESFSASDGTRFGVTASFGVARGRRGVESWPLLVELADAALYRAKTDGRNRVRFARDATAPALDDPFADIGPPLSADHKGAHKGSVRPIASSGAATRPVVVARQVKFDRKN
ncbi:diguanylate cyclase [Rhizobium sp. BR 314]|uniref:GGDEF domain-containing protein n=1 Tax=Rhizobium sp. BR 314 TaxID=3040013 RepID=UPI0039BF1AD0